MKKKLNIEKTILRLLMLFVFLAGYTAKAQLSNYCFTATTGTYTYLSGGTAVNGIEGDDANVTSIPFGFTFNYMGTGYTLASVSSNGWLSFTNGNPSAANSRTNGIALTTPATLLKTLYPLWDDLDGTSAGIASYQTSGSSPNRVFTMEWRNWEWNYNANVAVISFQVKLYETTNVIEYWYKSESGSINASGSGYTSGASIGLNDATGGSGHYLSLDGTGASPSANTATPTDNLLVKPATNQVYRFTPVSAPTVTSFSPSPVCTGASVTLTGTNFNACVSGVSFHGTAATTFAFVNATTITATVPAGATTGTISVTTPGGTGTSVSGLTINAAPSISSQPATQAICTGNPVTFTVTASGSPSPTYQWRKGGVNISGATSTSYNIAAVSGADAATYDVVVTNTCNSVTSSGAVLTVNTPASISVQPVSQTKCTGTSVTFSVTAAGTSPTYQWRKGGVNISGATSSSYNIASVAAGDAATYDVVVSVAGCTSVTSSGAVLTINAAPSISTQPSSQTICNGNPVTFTVAGSGTPAPTYQWKKAGVDISGATSTSYNIAAVVGTDAATYAVVLTNSCNSVTSSNAVLTVNTPPSISVQPISQAKCAGQPVTFSVTAAGTSPAYQWRKAGVNISGATSSSYNIASVAAGDAATYDVVVSVNNCSSLTSSGAVLTVNALPTVFTVNGGGVYCSGGAGVAVGLSGSQSGVNYQLKIGGVATGSPVAGTGSAISFGSQTAIGTYTADATNATTTCAQAMTGSVAVSINPLPSSVSATPASSTVCSSATSTALTGAATTTSSTTINSDNFNGTPAYAATGTTSSSGYIFTQKTSPASAGLTSITNNDGSKFMIAVAASFGSASTSSTLTSSVINTTSYSSLSFSFRHSYTKGSEAGVSLQVSTDAGNTVWSNINTSGVVIGTNTYTSNQGSSSNFVTATFNLTPFINNANLKIRFNFVSNVNTATSWWAIDDATLNGNPLPLFSWSSNTGAGVDGLPGAAAIPSLANKNITVNPTATTIYTVTATDAITGCSNTSTGTVTVNPVATVSAGSNQTICSGSTAIMNGSFGGGAASAAWSTSGSGSFNNNNGNAIYTPSTADIVGGSVILTYTTNDPAGPCGSVNASMTLTINKVPSISSNPSNVTMCPGGNASFSVTAAGTGISYQWRKDGVDISGANSASYSINSISSSDAGTYDVVVSGTCSPAVTSNAAALAVNEVPSISAHPADVTICSGNSTVFSVSASGTGLTYQWRKGGVDISGANSSSYAINSISSSDAGSYDVVVSGTCSPAATSNAAALVVNEAPAITADPADITICPGISTTLGVSATGAGLTYQWRKDGVGISGANSSSYSINSISASDAGNYDVVVNGTCSPAAISNTAAIVVNEVPSISAHPADVTICPGNSTIFSVSASGTALTYQWRKDGVDISAANSSSYSINSINSSDAGSYDVVVSGTCSPAATSNAATLVVNEVPVITAQPVGITTCSGEAASFSVTATGTNLTYQWRKDGADINGATSSTYTLNSALSSDAGNYNVVINGACSAASNNAALTVHALPSVTVSGNNTICNNQSSNVLLDFTGSGSWNYTLSDGTDTYSGTAVSSHTTVSVTPPSPGVHIYTVTAVSDAYCTGSSNGSAQIIVNTGLPATAIAFITGGVAQACNGDVILISTNSVSGSNITYNWNTGVNTSVVQYSITGEQGTFTGSLVSTTNVVYAKFGTLSQGSSGYNICVSASNGCAPSSNTKCQFIRGIPSSPGYINGPVIVCSNTSPVSYTAGLISGASIYTWSFPGATFTNQGSANVTVNFPVNPAGQLCVTASVSCNNTGTPVQSPAKCITISNTIAIPAVINGPATVCPGSTQAYTFSVVNDPSASSYVWTLPAGVTGSSSTNSIIVNVNSLAGTPSICVKAVSVCGVSSTARCKNMVSGIPASPSYITGPFNGVCSGDQLDYSVTNVPGTVYTWSVPAAATGLIGQGTSGIHFTITPPFSSGQVSVTASKGVCAASSPRSATLYGPPATPATLTSTQLCANFPVSFTSGTPTGANPNSYVWYVNGGTISSTNTSTNILNVIWGSGNGMVTVSAKNICGTSGTKILNIVPNCREEGSAIGLTAFSVYPNPANDKVTVSIDAKSNATISFSFIDMAGRIVMSESLDGTAGMNAYEIDLHDFAKGIYTLQVQSANDTWKKKIVIE